MQARAEQANKQTILSQSRQLIDLQADGTRWVVLVDRVVGRLKR